MKKNKNFLIVILALALSAALLVGCAPKQQAVTLPEVAPVAEESTSGGVLFLKVNPEIALHYDANGNVTKVEACNADAQKLLKNFTGFEGKQAQEVLEELVQLIGNAGYLVEEAEGKARRIVLELDSGSQVPHEKFLEDMAAHVKQCVENTEWTGEVEYDYDKTPVKAIPAETEPAVPTVKSVNLCPTCGDDDCDDGEFCDDADELAENLREQENREKGIRCSICGDYDCDDGEYCDDADELQENLREEQPKPTEPKPTEPKPTKPAPTLCPICGDDDCDDGKYCDDADELEENLREQENREKGIRCSICGDYDCDDGEYCDDADELEENLREEQPKPTEPKPTEPKPTKPAPTLCPICGDDDCNDGENCDDWDELEENLREQENREKGIRCPVCGDDDCDDGDDCDDWDERFEDDDDDDDDDDHHHGRHHDD